MRLIAQYIVSTIGAIATMAISIPDSQANVFKDVWGVATDPLKLGKLSSSVERTLIQLSSLEGIANAHVEQRLEQIRSILSEAMTGSEAVINKMTALEEQVNKDAMNLIYRSQCAAEIAATTTLQRGFATFISNLIQADPRIKILGVNFVRLGTNEVEITDPDKAYISTRDQVMQRLSEAQNDGSKAYDILSAYQNLGNAAKFARCHYAGKSLETKFVREENEFERLSIPWVTVVDTKM